MSLKDYEKWREGYIDAIRMLGNILKILESVEDNKLRGCIKILQKDWSNYSKQDKGEKND